MRKSVLCALAVAAAFQPGLGADEGAMERGKTIYDTMCAMCHQAEGAGVPPVFPPLAGSDWLMADRARAVRVLAEGLEGKISVNGTIYEGKMPAQMLDDGQAADVLTFITNSWGNEAEPFTREEVADARSKTRYPTYEKLVGASSYKPLPEPPGGWEVKEVVRLDEFPTRMAGPAEDGAVFVLMRGGNVHRLSGNALAPWLPAERYIGEDTAHVMAAGITIGPAKRLWITTNRMVTGSDGMVYNDVHIWRSAETVGAVAPKMESWFHVRIPFGVGPFNHGVSHLAFGPDGALYVSSGSRTDSGEEGEIPEISKEGETELTACIWRFEGNFSEPKAKGMPRILARGIRNPYGFAWDAEGNLLTAANGPDADLAEEMDMIVEGGHYGFPYQFADHAASEKFYDHTPPAPANLEVTHPLKNIGPDGGKGFSTFTPHSCPGGMIWCGRDFPEPLTNTFLVSRYGNLISLPEDTGFDLLTVKPSKTEQGGWQAEVHTVMEGMGRPLDVLPRGDGSILILEYTRATDHKSGLGLLPGRILALSPK